MEDLNSHGMEDSVKITTFDVQFSDCTRGLGLKIIGGRSSDGREYGIYVRRILPGGLAENEGQLCIGDQLVQVNGNSLMQVTNEEAVAFLRNASASGAVHLSVQRTAELKGEFSELMRIQAMNMSTPTRQTPVSQIERPSSAAMSQQMAFNGQRMSPIAAAFSPLHRENQASTGSLHSAATTLPRTGHSAPQVPSNAIAQQHAILSVNGNSSTHVNGQNGWPTQNAVASMPNIAHSSIYEPNRPTLQRRLSLDRWARVPLGKLEMAIRYMGKELSAEQLLAMRSRLNIDEAGRVAYGEFVRVAREMFSIEIRPMNSAPQQVASPPHQQQVDSYQALITERNLLKHEVHRLQGILADKDDAIAKSQDLVSKYKKEVSSTALDLSKLETRVRLAEAGQRQARNAEQDCAEVISLLETQVAQLKDAQRRSRPSSATHPRTGDMSELQHKQAVLGCQLRRTEERVTTLTEALRSAASLAQRVSESLSAQTEGLSRSDSQKLSAEAARAAATSFEVLAEKPLPFGWEESTTSDGTRYYVNHVTQTTSWQLPDGRRSGGSLRSRQSSSTAPTHF